MPPSTTKRGRNKKNSPFTLGDRLAQFYINGAWVDPLPDTPTQPVVNPATEKEEGHISLATQANVNLAVAAAKAAFDEWSLTPKDVRLALLEKLLEVYLRRFEEMAQARQLGSSASHHVVIYDPVLT